ncbi:MAG: class C sortase [Corynebacterium casei]|uniref:class C sortase n=1 Tax=Corynebacterium casei TaxID=160386 RepID=UPI003BDC7AC9
MSKHRTEANSTLQTESRKRRRVFLPVIIILLGLAVLLYPVIATQWNNVSQQEAAARYEQFYETLPEEDKTASFEEAQQYNAERSQGPILDPWLARVSEDNTDYQDYLGVLDASDAMARLVVPSAQVDLPVYHGTSEKTLENGVGHLYGSDLPVGGEGTHSVLTAHTGLTNATLFDNLENVKEGDAIYVQVSGEVLKYQVFDTEIVLPEETEGLAPRSDMDMLTLITCTPYGINSHRMLVHAERVPMDANEVVDSPGFTWQWWMWALMAAALLVLVAMVWWITKQSRSQRGELEDE